MVIRHRVADLLKLAGGNWILRATILAGAILLLGLIWPADPGESARGEHAWASSSVSFHLAGNNWATTEVVYKNAVRQADNVWRDNTNWDPIIVTSAQNNDIHWGDQPVANVGDPWGDKCPVPTGSDGSWARECTKVTGEHITESDIVFNQDKNWGRDDSRVLGVAVHELGHSGGLKHDAPYMDIDGMVMNMHCNPRLTSRWTMCPGSNPSNAAWKATLERHDIDDANAMYP